GGDPGGDAGRGDVRGRRAGGDPPEVPSRALRAAPSLDSTVRPANLAVDARSLHCGRGRRAWVRIRSMPPAIDPMPPPGRTNRMMLLVFGTGAAIGLQSGLLHVFLWHSWFALVT